MSVWRTEHRDGVAIILIDLPDKGQNILTEEIMMELDTLLNLIETEVIPGGAQGLVIGSGKKGSFIAGADVKEIDNIKDPEEGRRKAEAGQKVLARIENLPIPTVAAINGYALGGGCELALACDYRIAANSDKVKIGLPETQLGIIPGFGGTQRLPRLVGIQQALTMILTGKPVDVRKAKKIGLVDRIAAPALLIDKAIELAKRPPARRRVSLKGISRLLEAPGARKMIFRGARKNVFEKSGENYPALYAAIDVVEKTVGFGSINSPAPASGYRLEAEQFGRMVVTDVSRNLRYLFFLTESRKKYRPSEAEPRRIRRAGVLGAGTMGGGIAWAFSSNKVPVRVKDINADALLGAIRAADKIYQGGVKRRKVTKTEAEHGLARISTTLDYSGFSSSDIVVEAVVERMDVKKEVLKQVESEVPPEAVIATNTSGLSIDEMASALEYPERFAGLHFFNPVNRMPLVEIIAGDRTDDQTLSTLFEAARLLGKKPILVQDSPGFLVNRILIPYLVEAARMLEEGVDPHRIDGVAEKFGMPMGPLALADQVGLDIGLHVARHLNESFGDRMAVPKILERLVERKEFGKKTGVGIYVYDERGDETEVNPALEDVLERKTELPEGRIEDRLFLIMLLEAGRCLEERVVASPDSIDMGMIFGTGFPPFRGGLMRWGSNLGWHRIEKRLGILRVNHGERFEETSFLRDYLG